MASCVLCHPQGDLLLLPPTRIYLCSECQGNLADACGNPRVALCRGTPSGVHLLGGSGSKATLQYDEKGRHIYLQGQPSSKNNLQRFYLKCGAHLPTAVHTCRAATTLPFLRIKATCVDADGVEQCGVDEDALVSGNISNFARDLHLPGLFWTADDTQFFTKKEAEDKGFRFPSRNGRRANFVREDSVSSVL